MRPSASIAGTVTGITVAGGSEWAVDGTSRTFTGIDGASGVGVLMCSSDPVRSMNSSVDCLADRGAIYKA